MFLAWFQGKWRVPSGTQLFKDLGVLVYPLASAASLLTSFSSDVQGENLTFLKKEFSKEIFERPLLFASTISPIWLLGNSLISKKTSTLKGDMLNVRESMQIESLYLRPIH